jgi:ABC-type transporter Mla maintaining outer membrane lipid asymmetry permease subunit MlaE
MADAMFRYAVTTGFFIGLVAIQFGTRARKSKEGVSDSVTSYQYLVSSSDSLFFQVQIRHPMRN